MTAFPDLAAVDRALDAARDRKRAALRVGRKRAAEIEDQIINRLLERRTEISGEAS